MNKFIHLAKYYTFQLFHSYAYIILNTFIFLCSILVVILTYFLRNNNLNNSSFIISISFQILLIIQILYTTIKIFNENKYNLSDIKLLGKNFYRNEIFWSKYFIVFINAFVLELLMCTFSCFTMLGLGVDSKVIGAMFVSNFIGLFINIFFFSCVLIISSIFFNRIWSPIVALAIVAISPLTSLVNNFLINNQNECNNINSNINDSNALVQYNKIYKFNQDNEVLDKKFVYNYNYSSKVTSNLNTNVQNSINYTNSLNYLIPGNINISLQEIIYCNINDEVSLNDYLMYNGSLAKIEPYNFKNLSSYIQDGYSYVLCNMNDQNYFDLSEVELSNLIINKLRELKKQNESIFNNNQELVGLLNSLKQNKIWNLDSFNERQINFIFSLLGINDDVFFYTWYYQQYLKGNIGNIISLIKYEFNNESLAELINYLWFSDNSYFNVIYVDNKNQNIIQFKEKLKLKYPINYMYNSNLTASTRDLNFFKNDLVRIQNNEIFILDQNGIYTSIDKEKFLKIFKLETMQQQSDWINYLTTQEIPTVGFIKQVYEKLASLDSNIVNLNLQNNNFDLTSFNQVFDLHNVPFSRGWIVTIIMQFSLIIFFMLLAYISYLKVRLD